MALRLLEAPAEQPVSLAEAKAHCRVDHTDEDALIGSLIAAATGHLDGASGILGRCMVTQEWALDLDAFPETIALPLAPVVTVDAVKYIDGSDALQTLDAAEYVVSNGRIEAAPDADWPVTRDRQGAVTVEFTAGYGAAEDVPAALKAAMLLMIGHWYANRESVIVGTIASELPMAVQALTTPYIFRAS